MFHRFPCIIYGQAVFCRMQRTPEDASEWQEVIDARGRYHAVNTREVWRYRHLLRMFVWRDIVSTYYQTVLGPVWFVVQPILTTYVFALVFGRFTRISSDGQPQAVFYFSGVILWSLFNESFLKISTTLKTNAGILKKIYFPRLILPLTTIIASLIRFLIQYVTFIILLMYFAFTAENGPRPNFHVFLTPLLLVVICLFSLGTGLIVASLTVRFRDLVFLITFGITLFMYVTPVIYPLSTVPLELRPYVEINPMTGVVEGFRHAYLGSGAWSWPAIGYSAVCSLGVLLLGLFAFNRAERNFIDTI